MSANLRHKMPYNGVVAFQGLITAKRGSDGLSAAWKYEGVIQSISGVLSWPTGSAPAVTSLGAAGTMSGCAPVIEIDSGLSSFGPSAVGLAGTGIIWDAAHHFIEYRE